MSLCLYGGDDVMRHERLLEARLGVLLCVSDASASNYVYLSSSRNTVYLHHHATNIRDNVAALHVAFYLRRNPIIRARPTIQARAQT